MKKKSTTAWILEWAGQKKSSYVLSVILAIGNVVCKIIPYFIIIDVVKMFLNGSKNFNDYAQFKKIVALSNLIQRIYHNDIRNMLP